MEGAGKGNRKEAALGETLVSPYINPTSQSAYSVWLLPPSLCTAGPVEVILAARQLNPGFDQGRLY